MRREKEISMIHRRTKIALPGKTSHTFFLPANAIYDCLNNESIGWEFFNRTWDLSGVIVLTELTELKE